MEAESVVGALVVVVAVGLGFLVGAIVAVLAMVRREAAYELAVRYVARLDPAEETTGRMAVSVCKALLRTEAARKAGTP